MKVLAADWAYRLRKGFAAGSIRLMPGLSYSLSWGAYGYEFYAEWSDATENLLSAEYFFYDADVRNWTFVPTFGAEFKRSIFTVTVKPGLGVRGHRHYSEFRWRYDDYTTGKWFIGGGSGTGWGPAAFWAKVDAETYVAFGKHYGAAVNFGFGRDIFNWSECDDVAPNVRTVTGGKKPLTDFTFEFTPTFSF